MANFFVFTFVFMLTGLQTAIIEDSLMYRVVQFKEITYDPSSHYFAEKPDRQGCAILGEQGWIKNPSFAIAVHELVHVRGFGEIFAYSVQAAIFSIYVTIFCFMFYVASEMGDDSSESRCPASLGIRPEGEERTPSDSPLYFSPLSPIILIAGNCKRKNKRNLEVSGEKNGRKKDKSKTTHADDKIRQVWGRGA